MAGSESDPLAASSNAPLAAAAASLASESAMNAELPEDQGSDDLGDSMKLLAEQIAEEEAEQARFVAESKRRIELLKGKWNVAAGGVPPALSLPETKPEAASFAPAEAAGAPAEAKPPTSSVGAASWQAPADGEGAQDAWQQARDDAARSATALEVMELKIRMVPWRR